MSPNTLPEGTDTIIGDSDIDIDSSGAVPMDSGAEADATLAGADEGSPLDAATAQPGVGATIGQGGGASQQQGGSSGPASAGEAYRTARDQATEKASELKGQATDKLRAYAVGGKDKATETIQGFAKTIDDVATQIDEKIGGQYGDYARQAAQTLAGFASTIEEKDVDELFEQGRDLIRKSPGVAIGAAAALGFIVARLAKSGVEAASVATAAAGAANDTDRA